MKDINQIVPADDHGRYVVYASDYAHLDSDVINGGGTDDTEALQAILDKAPEWGGLHLIIDGAALVRGLDIYSNTTIECESKDCGFFLASGANRSLVQNAHLNFVNRIDRNITLLGGTYNHNAVGQEHHITREIIRPEDEVFGDTKWVITMEFYGVEYLTMKDVTIRNQRTFAMLVANWFRVTMENITIELPDNMFAQNQDGIHFWGSGQYLNMRNIMGESGDDFIALAPDEHDCKSDITDVVIDGVYLNNADQGIRMLSREKGRLDRVVVRNVSGTYKSCGFFINAWFPGSGGNFGNILLEDIDLRQTVHKYVDYTTPFLFRIGGMFETLTLRNISHHNPANPISLFDVGQPFHCPNDEHVVEHSRIGTLVVDGIQIDEKEQCDTDVPYMTVLCPVDRLVVRNAVIKRNASSKGGCLVKTTEHADIGTIHFSGFTVDGMETLIDHQAGKIGTLMMNDILCRNVKQPLIIGDAEIGALHTGMVVGAEIR